VSSSNYFSGGLISRYDLRYICLICYFEWELNKKEITLYSDWWHMLMFIFLNDKMIMVIDFIYDEGIQLKK